MHVEQLRNIRVINSTTRLYLVGSFYEVIDWFRQSTRKQRESGEGQKMKLEGSMEVICILRRNE